MIREYVEKAIDDAGGYTKGVEHTPTKNMGITQKMLTDYRGSVTSASDLQHLTVAEAEQILYELLWSAPGFAGLVAEDSVAKVLFENAVQFGPIESVVLLQRALDMPPTGILSAETKWAVKHEQADVLVAKIQGRVDRLTLRLRK